MEQLASNRPLVVVWQVTSACSLRCPFCRFSSDSTTEAEKATHTPLEEVIRIAHVFSDFAAAARRPVHLSFLGGEPFQWPALRGAAEHIRARTSLGLGITTNGASLTNRSNRRFLLAHFERITVSVDAPAITHDALRGLPGLFARIGAGLKALAHERTGERQPVLAVNTVLMHKTVTSFRILCEELLNWGIDEISFNQLGIRDRPDFGAAELLTPEDLEQLDSELPKLRSLLVDGGVKLLGGPKYLQRMKASAAGIAVPIIDCGPATDYVFIDRRGLVAPCSYTVSDYGIPSLEIREVADISLLKGRFRARKRERCSVHCMDCPSTQVFEKFVSEDGALDETSERKEHRPPPPPFTRAAEPRPVQKND